MRANMGRWFEDKSRASTAPDASSRLRYTQHAMKNLLLLILALGLGIGSLNAQDWAKAVLDKSPRHQEWVPVKHGNRTVQTFVVYPERKDKAPVVIVVHEIFGL